MVGLRRTRLISGALSRKTARLKVPIAISNDLKVMSSQQIVNLIKTPIEQRKQDSILNEYVMGAKQEVQRRKELKEVWGEPKRSVNPLMAVSDAELKVEKGIKAFIHFNVNVMKGKLADDLIKGIDHAMNRMNEFYNRGIKAEKRWEAYLKAHKVLKKTETDYLKAGWDIETRFDLNVRPSIIKAHIEKQRKAGKHEALVIPVKVEGKKMYSLLTK